MRRFFRNNGLSLVLLLAFMVFVSGQAFAGWKQLNYDQAMHHEPAQAFGTYLFSSHFWEAVFENCESEFLQMSAYVVLTAFLFQKGSAESKDPDEPEDCDEKSPGTAQAGQLEDAVAPGGWRSALYAHSLSLALFTLFVCCWIGHVVFGAANYSEDLRSHGEPAVTAIQYLSSSRLWFESLQNWQSEFLAVLAIVVLSIRLRERGSPESKEVSAPHGQTGR